MSTTVFKVALASLFCVSLAACAAGGPESDGEGTTAPDLAGGETSADDVVAKAVSESGGDVDEYGYSVGCCAWCSNRDAFHYAGAYSSSSYCFVQALSYCAANPSRGSLKSYGYGSCMNP